MIQFKDYKWSATGKPLAYTNKRDNMRAWLAARSDPPQYGKLTALEFPKAKLVYGPKQIDARIDQDTLISQQLSLWNRRGSQERLRQGNWSGYGEELKKLETLLRQMQPGR